MTMKYTMPGMFIPNADKPQIMSADAPYASVRLRPRTGFLQYRNIIIRNITMSAASTMAWPSGMPITIGVAYLTVTTNQDIALSTDSSTRPLIPSR